MSSATLEPPPVRAAPPAPAGAGSRRLARWGVVAVVVAVAGAVFARDAGQLTLVIVNGLTAAALYFLVASGFTLIFGLMRVTNLAHGAVYLLGGYIGWAAYDRTGSWVLALAAGAAAAAVLGVVMQRLLLPIYGQELREALITLGLAIVVGDLLLAAFGGQARDIDAPAGFAGSVSLLGDLTVPSYRLLVIGLALAVGGVLWVLLRRTRFGMTVRAGVDDRVMVAATGTNVRVLFAAVFALGAGLAGASGVIGGSFLSLQPGEDSRYLLYSLVVVIVGGLGSIPGAALGALLVGLVDNLAAYYLPTWSSLVTFGLLVVVLAVRPQGLLGRDTARKGEGALPVTPGIPVPRRMVPVVAGAVVLLAAAMPFLVTQFVLSQILTKALWLGLAALSLVFLAATVGMVSLAQTATYGVAGYTVAHLTVLSGATPWLAAVLGVLASVLFATVVGAVAARSRGVYLLMLTLAVGVFAYYFALQARPVTGGFGGINDVRAPSLGGLDLGAPVWLYYTALVVAVAVYAGLTFLRRTPLGLALQGVRDSDARMRSLGHDVTALRITAFALSGLVAGLAGVLAVWFNGQVSPGAVDLQRTIDLLVVAVIGGLYRLEGAFVGALAVTLLANFAGDVTGRVNTLIGACFVLALVASPGGIVGAAGRAATLLRPRPPATAPPA